MSAYAVTQQSLRAILINPRLGGNPRCAACGFTWTIGDPEQHGSGCPCDPDYIVIRRDDYERTMSSIHQACKALYAVPPCVVPYYTHMDGSIEFVKEDAR